MCSTEDGVGAFSFDGTRWARSSSGEARIWSTDGGSAPTHSLIPPAHLAAPISCLCWLSSRRGKKRKSSNAEDNETGDGGSHVAFGTSSGKIFVCSIAQAKIESVLEEKDGDSKKIVCLEWNKSASLFSCSEDSTVKEWDLSDGSFKTKFNMNKLTGVARSTKATLIKLIPQRENDRRRLMLSAALQINLWCLNSKTVLKTMIGHANDVCYLDFLSLQGDKLFAISGAVQDRILSFWPLDLSRNTAAHTTNGTDKKSSKSKKSLISDDSKTISTPAYNLLMEDVPRQASCKSTDDTSTIKLIALTRSGVVHYYEHTLNGFSTKPIKPTTTIQTVTQERDSDVKPFPITTCCLTSDSVQIGHALEVGMVFERIVPNVKEKTQVLIRTNNKSTKSEHNKRQSESATKIKHAESSESSVAFLPAAQNRVDNTGSLKRSLAGNQIDVPMESRLANLSLAQSGNKQAADTNSIAQLLVQALHSKDTKLLQAVFDNKDREVALNSLNRLPVQYIPSLIDHLVEMLAGKTEHCKSACVWAEALCKAKSSSLLSLGSTASDKMTALKSALIAKLPSLAELMSLQARLALSLHRMSDSTTAPAQPLLDYKDTSSDEDDVDNMDDTILNNPDDDSASWDEEEENDNYSKQSDQEMSEDSN